MVVAVVVVAVVVVMVGVRGAAELGEDAVWQSEQRLGRAVHKVDREKVCRSISLRFPSGKTFMQVAYMSGSETTSMTAMPPRGPTKPISGCTTHVITHVLRGLHLVQCFALSV